MFKKLQTNESLFLVLLGYLFIRLAFSNHFLSLSTLVVIFFLGASFWLYLGKESKSKQKLKLLFPLVSMPILYILIGKVVSILELPKKDLLLQKIDQYLIDGNLSIRMKTLVTPVLTELMYIVYMLFFYYLVSTLIHYMKRQNQVTKSFYAGLFSIYWIGFFCYLLFPAEGPYIHMASSFGSTLKEGLALSGPIHNMIFTGTNLADVFPSLHCSISAFCLFFDWIHRRQRFYLSVTLCVLIWVSTIYLGYHYFIDVISGLALTMIALQIAKRTLNKSTSFQVVQNRSNP